MKAWPPADVTYRKDGVRRSLEVSPSLFPCVKRFRG
jgi:hypothetical protein